MSTKVAVRPSSATGSARSAPRTDVDEGQTRTRKPFHTRYPASTPPARAVCVPKDWISAEEFKGLDLGGVDLSDEARRSINDAMNLVADGMGHQDDGIRMIKTTLTRIGQLRKSLDAFRRDLRAVEANEIPYRGRSLLELWRALLPPDVRLPMEWPELRPALDRCLAGLDKVAALEVEQLGQRKLAKRGTPKRFQHLDTLILILAETYAREGGVPSAAYQVGVNAGVIFHRRAGAKLHQS